MRAIWLTHNYPRHEDDLSGNFLHSLACKLAAAGIDVQVIAPADSGECGAKLLGPVKVHRVRYSASFLETLAYTGQFAERAVTPWGGAALLGLLRSMRRAARHYAQGAPSVVHAHWWFPAGFAAPPELPLIITIHGSDARLLSQNRLLRSLGRRTLRRAEMITAVSPAIARLVADTVGQVIPRHAVQPMPTNVADFGRSTGTDLIVTVARATTQKRLELFLEAMHLLRQRRGAFPISVVADGPELGRLIELADTLGFNPPINFVGRLPRQEVAKLLATARLMVLPSRAEGYGLAVAEALMSGVPAVVTSDGGGAREIIENYGGGMVAEPDPTDIARASALLLDDPTSMVAAWDAGEHLRKLLHPEQVAARVIDWYRQVHG